MTRSQQLIRRLQPDVRRVLGRALRLPSPSRIEVPCPTVPYASRRRANREMEVLSATPGHSSPLYDHLLVDAGRARVPTDAVTHAARELIDKSRNVVTNCWSRWTRRRRRHARNPRACTRFILSERVTLGVKPTCSASTVWRQSWASSARP